MNEGNGKKGTGPKTTPREGPLVQGTSMPIARGVSRPVVGARQRQLVGLGLDVSGSMAGGPIKDLIHSCLDLTAELAKPENRGAFDVLIVTYASDAKVHLPQQPATGVNPEDISSLAGMPGGMTNIGAGLMAIEACLTSAQGTPGNWARPLIVCMTDGQNNMGTAPELIADRLRASADIVAVGLGPAADFALLQRIANTPQHALRCGHGADLRQFFIAVGRTVSQAARTGQNAMALLGNGGVVRG